jgi:uncharacterized phosphosugar-binding protein
MDSNYLPVELGLDAKKRCLYVVSVSSLAYARVAPQSALGLRLDQVADQALGNGGLPGDALLELEDCDWRVGPSSTILGALLRNSLNMSGAAEHNAALLDEWRKVNPHL